jgi:hypothetical protein
MWPPLTILFIEASKPALYGSVPAGTVGLSLFRFEGTASLAGPGDVPTGSFGAGSRSCLARVELFVSSPGSGRLSVPARGGKGTAHPVRALVGLLFSPVPSGLCGRPGRDAGPRVRAAPHLENSKASTSIFVLQATKSQRRMPWRLKPKKDVGDCEKPREAVYQASIRGCPNGATQHLS